MAALPSSMSAAYPLLLSHTHTHTHLAETFKSDDSTVRSPPPGH